MPITCGVTTSHGRLSAEATSTVLHHDDETSRQPIDDLAMIAEWMLWPSCQSEVVAGRPDMRGGSIGRHRKARQFDQAVRSRGAHWGKLQHVFDESDDTDPVTHHGCRGRRKNMACRLHGFGLSMQGSAECGRDQPMLPRDCSITGWRSSRISLGVFNGIFQAIREVLPTGRARQA